MYVECKICKKILDEKSLARHVSKAHGITSREYYDTYIKCQGDGVCELCGKPTAFIKLSVGYNKRCKQCNYNSKETQDKRRNTNIKKYGVENVSQLKEIKEKKVDSYIRKYNVDNPMHSKEVKLNRGEIFYKKYGVDNPSKLYSVKEKKKSRYLKEYGVDNPAKSDVVKSKYQKTMMGRYGVSYPLQNEIIKNKTEQTNIERYGTDNPSKNAEVKKRQAESSRLSFYNKLITSERLCGLVSPLFTKKEYVNRRYDYTWRCNLCGTIFEDCLDYGQIPRCPKCFPKLSKTTSIGEKEILDFIKNMYTGEIFENDRSVLGGKELDIYIPEKHIAIEYDGLYYHSETNGKYGKYYHLNKTNECNKKGITLLHIFEDEWNFKQEIVKSIIKTKMGFINKKIYARKCTIQKIKSDTSELFLEDNHLQGFIRGASYGLYHDNILVSVMVVGKPRYNKTHNLEILRYCNIRDTIVVGGLSKLVKFTLKNKSESSIMTYCDMRYSVGAGYKSIGFKEIGTSEPTYHYIKNNTRYSRIRFQKHKLVEQLENFDDKLTEWGNMQINGYNRIWDCGNIVLEYNT